MVCVQLYRVAVKELLPRTAQRDAIHEANQGLSSTLTLLVCCLYVCPATKNITQFTLFQEMQHPRHLTCAREWILVCAQLIDALSYLHSSVKIIHNDIKSKSNKLCINVTGSNVSNRLW